MNDQLRFIVIDDDNINNKFCRVLLRSVFPDCSIETFEVTELGYEHIITTYNQPNCGEAILFLDISMPSWTGWDFLKKFGELDEDIRQCIRIYMLSGTVRNWEIERAKNHPDVAGFIKKPLTVDKIFSLMQNNNVETRVAELAKPPAPSNPSRRI